jgi:hypothetical protein
MPHINSALDLNAESCWQRPTQPPLRSGFMARLGGASEVLRAAFSRIASSSSAAASQEREISLATHQLWSGVFLAPTRVLCHSGQIWITQTNDGEDYILRAGEEFVASPQSQIIISAFDAATVELKECAI